MNKSIVIGIGTIVVLLIGGLIWGLTKTEQASQQFQAADPNRPVAELSSNRIDLGNMKTSDEKTETVTVKNTGGSPLVLSNLSTSCDCTFAKMVFTTHESPVRNMHSPTSWSDEIAPGEEAKLLITYKPKIMPVIGPVSRTVYAKTNDPNKPNLEVTMTAEVQSD